MPESSVCGRRRTRVASALSVTTPAGNGLEENPYRSESKPYVLFGAIVERKVGPVRLFLNAENLSNVRQTRWDSLLLPMRGVDGRWTVDAWAPLEGRVFNGGVRFRF